MFPISYDKRGKRLVLAGDGGVRVMIGLFLKAKFGEAFDTDALFNPGLASVLHDMTSDLKEAWQTPSEAPFDRDQLNLIGQSASCKSEWRALTDEARIAYLQDIIAFPWRLSDAQIAVVLEAAGR